MNVTGDGCFEKHHSHRAILPGWGILDHTRLSFLKLIYCLTSLHGHPKRSWVFLSSPCWQILSYVCSISDNTGSGSEGLAAHRSSREKGERSTGARGAGRLGLTTPTPMPKNPDPNGKPGLEREQSSLSSQKDPTSPSTASQDAWPTACLCSVGDQTGLSCSDLQPLPALGLSWHLLCLQHGREVQPAWDRANHHGLQGLSHSFTHSMAQSWQISPEQSLGNAGMAPTIAWDGHTAPVSGTLQSPPYLTAPLERSKWVTETSTSSLVHLQVAKVPACRKFVHSKQPHLHNLLLPAPGNCKSFGTHYLPGTALPRLTSPADGLRPIPQEPSKLVGGRDQIKALVTKGWISPPS